jgi:hypothetical protein
MKSKIFRTLAALLVIALAGTTEIAQACQAATPAQPQHQTSDQAQQAQPQNPAPAQQGNTSTQGTAAPAKENNASDPTHVPAPAEVLPNAPSTVQDTQTSTTPAATAPQTKDQPLGTAAAEAGVTRGGAASKPAGTAVAGRKQNQSRGLLIKVGAVLAAGAALGTVYALSRGTSPVPPGAVR